MNEQISRILEKLKVAKNLSCFGSDAHQFRLAPPLSQKEITDFEEQHSIRLPEDFRLFVTEAGGSGAGPFYGILPMKRWLEAYCDKASNSISKPSPLIPTIEYEESWPEQLGCSGAECTNGTITIVNQGCTYYVLLIVTGIARGRVVYFDQDLQPPYFPENANFLSWYERWLDELIANYDDSWFGYGIPGTETELRKIIKEKNESKRRAGAVASIGRLPNISEETINLLRQNLNDSNSQMCVQCIHKLGKFGVRDAIPEILPFLTCEHPEIQDAALRAVAALGDTSWQKTARQLLTDKDENRVRSLLMLLSEYKVLTFDDCRLLNTRSTSLQEFARYMLKESSRSKRL
jgi:hypothetical protein